MSKDRTAYRQYTHHKTGNRPVNLAVNVDKYIKDKIQECAKIRNVSMNKVINELFEKAIPDLDAQIEMFNNLREREENPPPPII